MRLTRLLEKKPNRNTIPITKHHYNDGSGMLNPMSTGKIINRMFKGGTGLSGLGTSNLATNYGLKCVEEERLQAEQKERDALANLTKSTSLYGNTNNAIFHEKLNTDLDQSGMSVDYHHHNNFNTKPSPEGNEGIGGYMNLNLGGTPKSKNDMNQNVTNYGYTPEKVNDYKQNSNWLTQSGTKQEENLTQNLLNNFNASNNFSPKRIKNNDLLGYLSK